MRIWRDLVFYIFDYYFIIISKEFFYYSLLTIVNID